MSRAARNFKSWPISTVIPNSKRKVWSNKSCTGSFSRFTIVQATCNLSIVARTSRSEFLITIIGPQLVTSTPPW